MAKKIYISSIGYMDIFEHRLRSTLHSRSIQNIMNRPNIHPLVRAHNTTPKPKPDNITTYFRKFEIQKENINLAKRIINCGSEHRRDRYVKEWKDIMRFLKVRSKFKPTLDCQSPKICRFEAIPGRGSLLLQITFDSISSVMSLLSQHSLYLLKFIVGSAQIVPDRILFTLDKLNGYKVVFYIPVFLRKRSIQCKLMKVVENDEHEAGHFMISLSSEEMQTETIMTKLSKPCGQVKFTVKQKTTKASLRLKNKSEITCFGSQTSEQYICSSEDHLYPEQKHLTIQTVAETKPRTPLQDLSGSVPLSLKPITPSS